MVGTHAELQTYLLLFIFMTWWINETSSLQRRNNMVYDSLGSDKYITGKIIRLSVL